jgi:hypothetical protein
MMTEDVKSYTIKEQLLNDEQIIKDNATQKMKIEMQKVMIKNNLNMMLREKF